MVYRRFGYLQSRLLLEKQERLRLLEKELDTLDKCQTNGEDDEMALCTLDTDLDIKNPREELMARVENAFNEYGCSLPVLIPSKFLT